MSNFISLEKARELVKRYRERRGGMVTQEYADSLSDAETFDRSQFDVLLGKDGCTGLRIYYGMSDDKKVHAIVVGVNAKGDDMITVGSSSREGDGGADDGEDDEIIEDGVPCPPTCPSDSVLYP